MSNDMTPTERAKHWALETLINQMEFDEKYSGDDKISKAERKARAKIIIRMVADLEDAKVILSGTVLPSSITQYGGHQ